MVTNYLSTKWWKEKEKNVHEVKYKANQIVIRH